MGSPGMPARAQEQDPPSGVEPPATPQPPCPQTTEEPAGGALQGSPEGMVVPILYLLYIVSRMPEALMQLHLDRVSVPCS